MGMVETSRRGTTVAASPRHVSTDLAADLRDATGGEARFDDVLTHDDDHGT